MQEVADTKGHGRRRLWRSPMRPLICSIPMKPIKKPAVKAASNRYVSERAGRTVKEPLVVIMNKTEHARSFPECRQNLYLRKPRYPKVDGSELGLIPEICKHATVTFFFTSVFKVGRTGSSHHYQLSRSWLVPIPI